MSVLEQDELVRTSAMILFGYGPLEPLLARDEIFDIMVNGSDTTYIEVTAKSNLAMSASLIMAS